MFPDLYIVSSFCREDDLVRVNMWWYLCVCLMDRFVLGNSLLIDFDLFFKEASQVFKGSPHWKDSGK